MAALLAFIHPLQYELLTIVLLLTLVVVPFWRIFTKAGFPGALALLMLIPLVNLALIFFLAFANWPALRRNSDLISKDRSTEDIAADA